MEITQDCFLAAVDASNFADETSFYEEIGKALKFPDFFGQNLDALADCLNDLEWLNAAKVILVINNQSELMRLDRAELVLEVLRDAMDENNSVQFKFWVTEPSILNSPQ